MVSEAVVSGSIPDGTTWGRKKGYRKPITWTWVWAFPKDIAAEDR
jgi:hypothetical protein